jgi:hypothetical protein
MAFFLLPTVFFYKLPSALANGPGILTAPGFSRIVSGLKPLKIYGLDRQLKLTAIYKTIKEERLPESRTASSTNY